MMDDGRKTMDDGRTTMDDRQYREGYGGRMKAWVLGCAPWQGVVRYPEGGFRRTEGRSVPSTIYYSTKVRFCDRVAVILILVCRDLAAGRRVSGG